MALVSLLKNPNWKREYKTALLVVVSVSLAGLREVLFGNIALDSENFWKEFGANAAIVLSSASVIYNLYFHHTKPNATLGAKKIL